MERGRTYRSDAVVKQMRSELTAQIDPFQSKLEATADAALLAREETTALNARLSLFAASITKLLQNQVLLFQRVGHFE